MSAEGGGGGLLSRIINSAKSFLGISSNEKPAASPIEHTELDEITISANRKPNWFQRNFSKSKLSNDWKNIKERSGGNHFVNWFKNLDFSGGFYFYDDDGKAKGDQSLRKRVHGRGAEAINVTGFIQAGSSAKGGEGIKYDIEDVKTTISIFNNTFSGLNLGNSIPDSKVEVNRDFTWDIFYDGATLLKYSQQSGEKSRKMEMVIPVSRLFPTLDSLNAVNKFGNGRSNQND